MTKNQLKTGMVAETRNGERYLVLTGNFPTTYGWQYGGVIIANAGFITFDNISDNLESLLNYRCFDIVKVYKGPVCGFDSMLKTVDNPIWQREPEIDWSKVPMDTKVLVRESNKSPWLPRHFREYKDSKVITWNNGETSFTSEGFSSSWPYAKLA